jgi:hypothetical protein
MSDRERARRDAQRRASVVDQFCERNQICRDTFYKEVRRGRLRARKIGRKTIVTPEDEAAWKASLPLLELPAA